MVAIPKRVKSGQPIRAAEYNKLVDAVTAVMKMRAGDGMRLSQDSGGIRLSLIEPRVDMLLAVITKRTGPNGDIVPSGAVDLSEVTYDVRVWGNPRFQEFTGLTPELGRPSPDVMGVAAQVGDECYIVRRKGPGPTTIARLWILTETTSYGDCPPPAAASQAPMVTMLMAQVASLEARLALLEGSQT